MALRSHTCADRMWSGAREHYASEISNRKLLLSPHIKDLNQIKACHSSVHNLDMALVRQSSDMLMDVVYVGVGVTLLMVTFDLYHAPASLTLAHPNPSTSVNELEDPGAIEGSVRGACLLVKGW